MRRGLRRSGDRVGAGERPGGSCGRPRGHGGASLLGEGSSRASITSHTRHTRRDAPTVSAAWTGRSGRGWRRTTGRRARTVRSSPWQIVPAETEVPARAPPSTTGSTATSDRSGTPDDATRKVPQQSAGDETRVMPAGAPRESRTSRPGPSDIAPPPRTRSGSSWRSRLPRPRLRWLVDPAAAVAGLPDRDADLGVDDGREGRRRAGREPTRRAVRDDVPRRRQRPGRRPHRGAAQGGSRRRRDRASAPTRSCCSTSATGRTC